MLNRIIAFFKKSEFKRVSRDNLEKFLKNEVPILCEQAKIWENDVYYYTVKPMLNHISKTRTHRIMNFDSLNDADCGLYAFDEHDFYECFADMLIPRNHRYWRKRGFRFNDFKERRSLLRAICMRGYDKGYFSIQQVNYYLMADEFYFHGTLSPWKEHYYLPWFPQKPKEYSDQISYFGYNAKLKEGYSTKDILIVLFLFLCSIIPAIMSSGD